MYQTFRELACRKNRDDFEHQRTRTRTLDPLIKSHRSSLFSPLHSVAFIRPIGHYCQWFNCSNRIKS